MNRIKDNWQILATLATFLCFLDIYMYYSQFGINISSFITLGEAIVLVLPSLIYLCGSLFVIWCILTGAAGIFAFRGNYMKFLRILANKSLKYFLLKRVVPMILISIVTASFFYDIPYLTDFVFSYPTTVRFIAVIFTFSFLSSLYRFTRSHYRRTKIFFFSHNVWLVTASLYTVFFLEPFHQILKYNEVLRGENNFNVTFVYDGKIVETTPKYIALGITQKYLFIWDTKTQKTDIFEVEKAQKLAIIRPSRINYYIDSHFRLRSQY